MNQAGPDIDAGTSQEDVSWGRPLPGLFLMTNSFETGGSEHQFTMVARSLSLVAFRVHVGCIQRRGPLLDESLHPAQFPLCGRLYGLSSLWTRFRLAAYLRRNRLTIAHAFDFYTNLTLIPAAKLAGVPVIVGSQRQLGDLLTHAQSRAQAAMFQLCDAVVCNSRAAANRLIEDGLPKKKVRVINNGLPPSAFAPAAPAIPRRDGVLRVGIIARMNTRSKNHELFLRAAARLQSKFPALEFLLIGDGPLRLEFERLAESLGVKAMFLGERTDIPAIMASLDISVLPSSSESLSNVILESMAAGIPVVASRVGGNAELITPDRGILVTPGDDHALADAIERLARDQQLRAAFAQNAKKFAQENFTLEQMRQRHEDLYVSLLESKKTNATDWLDSPPHCRIRIAIVAASPHYVGGQSVQAGLLVNNWHNDPEVKAHFLPIDPPFFHALAWTKRIPFLRTIVRQPLYLASLYRGLTDIDIAHIFSASFWSFLVAPMPAWLIARLLGKHVIIHYHSGEAREHLRRFPKARPVLEDADCLVVPSGHLVNVFREFGLEARVVPNLVDVTQFSFRERRPLRPNLICTRGFHPYYSMDVVVRAFALIQRAFPAAKLTLVGIVPTQAQTKNLVRELKLPGVNFPGAVSHPQIASLYDDADIFINASHLDNMPVSILEAFASGTPVASTAPEGMEYLIEHERTGLLSAPGDAAALAANVLRLVNNPDLASRLALNAHEKIQHYIWPAVREQWLEIYRSMHTGSQF